MRSDQKLKLPEERRYMNIELTAVVACAAALATKGTALAQLVTPDL
jgi:hypothetical protein